MTLSAILILKFDRDSIRRGDPFFYFHFFGLWKNLSIFQIKSSCSYIFIFYRSIGENSYSLPPQRTVSQQKSKLSLITNQYEFLSIFYISIFWYVYIIYFSNHGFMYKKIFLSISSSLHPISLFLQCDGKYEKETFISSHFFIE